MADANDDALATSSDEEAAIHSHARAREPEPVTGVQRAVEAGTGAQGERDGGGEDGGGDGDGAQPGDYSSPSRMNLLSAVPTVALSPRHQGFDQLGSRGGEEGGSGSRRVQGGTGGVWELCPGCSLRGCLLGGCLAVLLALLIVVVATSGGDEPDNDELIDHSSKYFATGKSGAVAATNALAAKAGLEALEAGGNAVAAAGAYGQICAVRLRCVDSAAHTCLCTFTASPRLQLWYNSCSTLCR